MKKITILFIFITAIWGCFSQKPSVSEPLFSEKLRPQFHYTAPRNSLGDVEGLVYYDGEYHMHHIWNSKSNDWGNVNWFHAISHDLVHWKHLGPSITQKNHANGDWVYTGTAVIDYNNTTGFQTGDDPPMVVIHTINETVTGTFDETQNIHYSNDRGRTWHSYEGNPVIKATYNDHQRDPSVFWFEPQKKWVMVLFENGGLAFYSSKNLKEWKYMSRFNGENGFHECPDFFPLPVDGDRSRLKWVIHDNPGKRVGYWIGDFDGYRFMPEQNLKHRLDYGKNFAAAQTFRNIPEDDGRRIQIGWMAGGEYPGMPFNQQLSFPRELSLKTFEEGIRLCANPVREIERIRTNQRSVVDEVVSEGDNPIGSIKSDAFEIILEIEPRDVKTFGIELDDLIIKYFVADTVLTVYQKSRRQYMQNTRPLKPIKNRIKLQILIDRTSYEIFGNDGRIAISSCYIPKSRDDEMNTSIKFISSGGQMIIRSLEVNDLRSIWDNYTYNESNLEVQ